jgi:hypothetical protein
MSSAKLKGHSCILPSQLYLGNAMSSGIAQVEAVLSVGCQPLPNEGVKHRHQLSMVDSVDSDLTPHLTTASTFIQQHIAAGRKVLVHCKGGINRSSAVVVAYLVRYASPPLTMDEAAKLVKQQHSSSRMQPHYLKQIEQWSKDLQSTSTGEAKSENEDAAYEESTFAPPAGAKDPAT